jgi:ABC-type phosphate transport system permease subunit
MNDLLKKYLLYNLRLLAVGTGLNALIVGVLMSNGYSYLQSVPVGAFTAVNISFLADRVIFSERKKENKFVIPISASVPSTDSSVPSVLAVGQGSSVC